MEASHNRNADNSGAKRHAEAAMADRQWSVALSAWQAWWDAEGQQANLDPDAMHDRASYERVLGAFRRGEVEVLLGTQMIAKGLHFPRVTAVGVVSADASLQVPDFRAAERTFQIVAQVAGRAGRRARGAVSCRRRARASEDDDDECRLRR